MSGWWQSRTTSNYGLPPDQAEHVQRAQKISWLAVVLFVGIFFLIDFGITRLIDEQPVRLIVRWLLIGGTCAALTYGLSRHTLRIFVNSMRGERTARNEAAALADLAATVAAGLNIQDTLSALIGAVAPLFGEHVRCAIALPQPDGTLRFVAADDAQSLPLKGFAFRPGEVCDRVHG